MPLSYKALALSAVVFLTGCGSHKTAAVDQIVHGWEQLCVDHGPQQQEAEALASTYSLEPFDDAALQSRKDFVVLVNRARQKSMQNAPQMFPVETKAWWINRDANTFLIYTRGLAGGADGGVHETCAIEGDAEEITPIISSLSFSGRQFSLIGVENSEYWASQVGPGPNGISVALRVFSAARYKEREQALSAGEISQPRADSQTNGLNQLSFLPLGRIITERMHANVHYELLAAFTPPSNEQPIPPVVSQSHTIPAPH